MWFQTGISHGVFVQSLDLLKVKAGFYITTNWLHIACDHYQGLDGHINYDGNIALRYRSKSAATMGRVGRGSTFRVVMALQA